MTDENYSTPGLRALFFVGGAFILIGSVWLVALILGGGEGSSDVVTAQRAVAATANMVPSPTPVGPLSPSTYAERLFLNTDMATGSQEFSAITVNESTNRLMVADDEGLLFEFDLTSEGEPVVPARRTLRVAVGGGDIEGLAWMSDSTYVLAHENDGRLTIVEIDDETITIGDEHLRRVVDTGIREENGNGLEGVAYIPGGGDVEFVVVDERPPTLYLIGRDGMIDQIIALPMGLPDASDIWVAPDGSYWVLSDEGRVLVQLTLDRSGLVTPVDSLDLQLGDGRFAQPEGVAGSRDGTRLYVVGEGPGPGRFSFGFWAHP
jgi:uncharacterized protein YjiK